MKKTPKDEIPLAPEIIEFFLGHRGSAEDIYLSKLDEPKREMIRDILDAALGSLSDREMVVIGFSFFWCLSNYEIAKIMGLSREGVGKIKKRAIQKLRRNFLLALGLAHEKG